MERSCKDCNYVQHQIVEPQPSFKKGDRGEGVRSLQMLLTALGHNAGTMDGIYGSMLDAAFKGFAADNDLEFKEGTIDPAETDSLVNAWITSLSKDVWMGEGGPDSPVCLALTINPMDDAAVPVLESGGDGAVLTDEAAVTDEAAEESSVQDELVENNTDDTTGKGSRIITCNYTLTNLGYEDCTFIALLLNFGSNDKFTGDNLVMILDGTTLKANCGNDIQGTFYVSDDWGTGEFHFCALAVSNTTGDKWLSNVDSYIMN